MNCYQVTVSGKIKRWVGSMAECRTAKKDLVAELGCKPSAVEYVEAEVPTAKPDLLAFLNKNCVSEE